MYTLLIILFVIIRILSFRTQSHRRGARARAQMKYRDKPRYFERRRRYRYEGCDDTNKYICEKYSRGQFSRIAQKRDRRHNPFAAHRSPRAAAGLIIIITVNHARRAERERVSPPSPIRVLNKKIFAHPAYTP